MGTKTIFVPGLPGTWYAKPFILRTPLLLSFFGFASPDWPLSFIGSLLIFLRDFQSILHPICASSSFTSLPVPHSPYFLRVLDVFFHTYPKRTASPAIFFLGSLPPLSPENSTSIPHPNVRRIGISLLLFHLCTCFSFRAPLSHCLPALPHQPRRLMVPPSSFSSKCRDTPQSLPFPWYFLRITTLFNGQNPEAAESRPLLYLLPSTLKCSPTFLGDD